MKGVQASRGILVAAFAIALVGCAPSPLIDGSSSGSQPGSPAASSSNRPSAAPSPTPSGGAGVVASVQPDVLIDLDCSDFAGVASIGTIAGVTERDPRGVIAEFGQSVPLADMVRNAGGIACEFSDGGLWQISNAEYLYLLNTAWRGTAIYIVPNVGGAASDLNLDRTCGELESNGARVCVESSVVGTATVMVVTSAIQRTSTVREVRDLVGGIVSGAKSLPGPIVRAPGTFQPPRDCTTLVPTAKVATLLGGSDIIVDRSLQYHVLAEATFLTENIGCAWYRENTDAYNYATLHIYPGGAWATDLTLSAIATTPIDLVGLRDRDKAVSHCTDSGYGYWTCFVEAVVDGTWLRGIGSGPDQAISTAIAVAVTESALTHRD